MNWEARIRAILARAEHPPDDGVIEELAQHARAMYDASRADGLSPAEADQRVSEQLDLWRLDAARLRHRSRRRAVVQPPAAASSSRWFAGLAQDLRYASRLLRRQPRFTLLATVTIALGIAATTILFSITYGVLLKPLPWTAADRLVLLKETRGGNPPRFNSFSNTAYLAWRGEATTIDDIAAWAQRTVTLAGAGDPDRIRVTASSSSLFTVLGARPLIGSLFSTSDEVPANVVVLGESLWRERFGGEMSALGRVVQLDGQPHTIIGVLPETLAYPDRRTRAWVPFHVPPSAGNYLAMFNAVARLRPGVTPAQAAAEGTARGRFALDTGMTTMAIFGGNGPIGISAMPMKDALTADVRQPLVVLLAAVVLLLVTATANVGGLQLARAATRRREMAIRAALGAGRTRVLRQLLAESLLLGVIGGGAGVALAWSLHGLLPTVLPADFPRIDDLGFSTVVTVFAACVSILVSVVFGLLPAVRVRHLDLVASLSEDGTAPMGGRGSTGVGRARMAIMAGQIAIACVLLVGASLLGRSFFALITTDRGYNPAGVLTARLSLPQSLYTPERRYTILEALLERMARVPAVVDVAFTSELPLTAGGSTSSFTLRQTSGNIAVQASPRIVSPRSFAALGMRIVAGRGFTESDTDASLPVAMVNLTFVRRFFEGDPIGANVPMGAGYQQDDVDATVVGVVDDVQYLTAGDVSQPEIYYSFAQFKGQVKVPVVTLLVRTAGDPSALAATVRTAVRQADPALVPEAIMTMEDRLLIGLARPRLYTILLGAFAFVALLVAAVGLFAVLSQTVAQRSREIAVRTALGSRPSDIVRFVVGQGLAVSAAGLAIGLVTARVLARSMSSFLYGVTAYDWLTYIVVPLVLLAVAALACFLPARRAARMDPVQVLRSG